VKRKKVLEAERRQMAKEKIKADPDSKKKRIKLPPIDHKEIVIHPKEILGEIISRKIQEMRKTDKYTLKIGETSKIPSDAIELERVPSDIGKMCFQLVTHCQERSKIDLAIKNDRKKMKEYEKKYAQCIENSLNGKKQKTFEATISNQKLEIVSKKETKIVKLNPKIIRDQVIKVCSNFSHVSNQPFSRSMAQEWVRSTTFKNHLFDHLNKSLAEWRKTEGIKEKTILKYKVAKSDDQNGDKRKIKPGIKKIQN
jgi:hypothetical protein